QTTANASILLHVSADKLQNIPSGDNGADNDLTLFAVVDAPVPNNVNGSVIESDQTNDVQALSADPESIVGPAVSPNGRGRSVEALAAGAAIYASFRPAGGALTLKQAATIAGVDHFNWYQQVTVPTNWTVEVLIGAHFSAPSPGGLAEFNYYQKQGTTGGNA